MSSDGRTAMASGAGAERFAPSCPPEAVRPDGWIGVIGIGSLLSETSARFTSPNLRGFRVVRLSGYRRVFAHTAPVFFHRGIARGREISSLSMEPLSAADDPELAHGDLGLVATYFEIPGDEFPALAAREDRLARSPLWVADLNARAGALEARDRIEEDLLAERRLGFQREVPALRRIAERDGATRALELAAELAQESRPSGMLGWMEEVAAAEGLEEEAARWKAARLADEEASKRLQELDQAEAQAAASAVPGMPGALKVVPGAAMQVIRIGP